MTVRMLIDSRHREETRVAVVKGNRVEEFDFEAAARKQIKGNIYLAKVTRVEPSLQAAFIEYGGNRHGFLAFSEIHPDYYQIPREDREALLREERELEREEMEAAQAIEMEGSVEDASERADGSDDETALRPPATANEGHDDHTHERLRERRMALRRRYKIQDVIKRRQVLLVQVVKEERGNKGAALTTYLSLAGRYCVLMPNTSHGGGISRKISSAADRKRLKSIMDELKLPSGMAAIVRTAGLSRTKTEIKRDFDYLCRLWDDIRELTLSSTAPALIHEDSDLIKRAIRDIYSREIEEVIVDGDEGYAHARQFMKLLMPSHVKRVKHYIDPVPLFQRAQIETQLNAMFQPTVQLKSGGYIVINPTEALVSIDINSGRSTREHNIEDTALRTNLEAADEIARQLRLRDMAGLIVVDFIDMEHGGNVRRVERQMKEALKNDRARIQVGRISSFGLLEMSRQRLRTGVLEASTVHCPMCEGTGLVRSASSAALLALRALEEEAVRGRASLLTLRAGSEVAVYILNRKRTEIIELERRYGVDIEVLPDSALVPPRFEVMGAGGPPTRAPIAPAAQVRALAAPEPDDDDEIDDEFDAEIEADDELEATDERDPASGARDGREARDSAEGERRGRRRRRRGRRSDERPERDDRPERGDRVLGAADGEPDGAEPAEQREERTEGERSASAAAAEEERRGRRRRRGRRGGRTRLLNGAAGPERDAESFADGGIEADPRDDEPRDRAAGDAETDGSEPAGKRAGGAGDRDPSAAPKARRGRGRGRAAAADTDDAGDGASDGSASAAGSADADGAGGAEPAAPALKRRRPRRAPTAGTEGGDGAVASRAPELPVDEASATAEAGAEDAIATAKRGRRAAVGTDLAADAAPTGAPKRGSRRKPAGSAAADTGDGQSALAEPGGASAAIPAAAEAPEGAGGASVADGDQPTPKRARRKAAPADASRGADAPAQPNGADAPATAAQPAAAAAQPASAAADPAAATSDGGSERRGWWQRTFGS
ncbi:MAG: Rne/Rng family ribonuclease [Sphingomonadaceae bacterium]|nr:Rne/Rng family ribonuclease [Sphingomonadaceae bacterium]